MRQFNARVTIFIHSMYDSSAFSSLWSNLSHKEEHKDFQFGFESVSFLNQILNDIQYESGILLADNCPAITKGYVN